MSVCVVMCVVMLIAYVSFCYFYATYYHFS
jgi:hypothetical protein